MATLSRIGKTATRVSRDNDGAVRVRYHSTDVVTVWPDGAVTLNSGGYRTTTTKTRMMQAQHELNLPRFHVFQHDFDWYVETADGRVWNFRDGFTIDPQGDDPCVLVEIANPCGSRFAATPAGLRS